jgi:hypothetical protein
MQLRAETANELVVVLTKAGIPFFDAIGLVDDLITSKELIIDCKCYPSGAFHNRECPCFIRRRTP